MNIVMFMFIVLALLIAGITMAIVLSDNPLYSPNVVTAIGAISVASGALLMAFGIYYIVTTPSDKIALTCLMIGVIVTGVGISLLCMGLYRLMSRKKTKNKVASY